MAKHTSPMRLNDNLVNEAQIVAASMSRTAAEQIEFWSEVGKRVTANLTHAQTLQLMTGNGKVIIEEPAVQSLDVFALAAEVKAESQSSSLSKELLSKGQVLYEAAPEGGGYLIAHLPSGDKLKGKFVDGQFKVARKRKVA
jgi:hypothetical protein